MTELLAIIAQATGGTETGLIGGGLVGGTGIVAALIMMFRYKEQANRELIDTHKLRADESEKRSAEEAETRAQLQAAEIETRKLFAAALNNIAQSNAAIAEGLKVLSDAVTRAANRGPQ